MQFSTLSLIFAFAFAFHSALSAQDVPDPNGEADLAASLSVENATVQQGDSINYTAAVSNLSESVVATNLSLQLRHFPDTRIQLPENHTLVCENERPSIHCTLAELGPNERFEVGISFPAEPGGVSLSLFAYIVADQPDNSRADNLERESVTIELPAAAPIPGLVDLGIELQLDTDELQTVYTVRVYNNHETNVATNPMAGMLLDESHYISIQRYLHRRRAIG